MAKSGTLVVSLRSKGLASFSRQTFDIRHQAINFGIELFDVVISYVLTLYHLSWTSWMSMVISILCIAISMAGGAWLRQRKSNYTGDLYQNIREAGLDTEQTVVFILSDGINTGSGALAFYLPFLGALFLPLGLLAGIVFWRRELALKQMAGFKAQAVSLCLTACSNDSDAALAEGSGVIRKQVFLLLDNLHRYLHHKRPYARHFYLPYSASNDASTPGNEMLFHVSREMGILLRKVHLSVRDVHGAVQLMRAAGASEAHVDTLAKQVSSLHQSIEQLCNIKEMRSPVLLRSCVRWQSVVIFPIFMGFFCYCLNLTIPYLSDSIGIFVIHIQLALLVVTDMVIAMEDPFDDTSMDTLSLFEVLDHVAAMTTPEMGDDPVDVSHDTAMYNAAAKDTSVGGARAAPYVVDPKAPPRPGAAQDPPGTTHDGQQPGAAATVGVDVASGNAAPGAGQGAGAAAMPGSAAGAPAAPPAPVVYKVTVPSGTSTTTGRRHNPSLPLPPMPSNLT